MKVIFTYIVFLSCTIALGNDFSFQADDSLKDKFSQYDTLKYSYLPKYEIYGKYFNPFEIQNNFYSLEAGFKWHREKRKYLTSHLIAWGFGPYEYCKLLTISQMFRLSLKKIDWIHLELSYGLSFSHRYGHPTFYKELNGFGLGFMFRQELQFDIGPRSNVCISTGLSPQMTYEIRVPEPPASKVKGFHFLTFAEIPPLFHVGFNFYIK